MANPAFDWTSFRIFDDNCILDRTSFQATNILQACQRFDTWLASLRGLQNAPNNCGIPAARIANVLALLNRFFPNDRPFLNVSFARQGNNPRYFPDPVTVTFGNGSIAINDGPSALGYIFSIANRPSPGPNDPPLPAKSFSNYGLPLLTIFSRWLYLAYIKERNNPQGTQSQLTGLVPWMSCIMYTIDNNGGFNFLLGSTYVTNAVDPDLVDDRGQKRRIMNAWRRQEVLDTNAGLSYYNPSRVNNLPNLPPVVAAAACQAYLKLLRGDTSVVVPGRTLYFPDAQGLLQPAVIQHTPSLVYCQNIIFAPATAALLAAWTAAGKQGVIRPLPLDRVTGHETILATILDALAPIIQLRFNPPGVYNRQDPQLPVLFAAFIRAYYLPHMFLTVDTTDADFAQAEQNDLSFDAALAPFILALWTAHSGAMLDVLDNLHNWVQNLNDDLLEGGPREPRFGRCAETHPVVGIM
ncbi:hypothetical protein FSHL1_010179 [Fusarium sambucinum]